jgi:endonuclease/exonuclease/phosphatase (EEP) superfamily protein YafD
LSVTVCSWLCAASLVALWATVRFAPPDFWLPGLFLYGPRWIVCLPIVALVPLAIWLRSPWSGLGLLIATMPFAGISGFNVPLNSIIASGAEPQPCLRLLTCNVQLTDLRTQDLADLIRETRPDVVMLQECKPDDPRTVVGPEGWQIRTAGEFWLASRYPILDFEVLRRPDKEYRIVGVRATVSWAGKAIPVVSIHMMTPRRGLEAILGSPLRGVKAFREITAVQRLESELVRGWLQEFPDSILVAGDFNLTAEHALYRRDWSGLTDAFSRTSWGLGHTMFTRNFAVRIDHILCGPDWRPIRCWVGPDVGSAHRPVIADLVGGALDAVTLIPREDTSGPTGVAPAEP